MLPTCRLVHISMLNTPEQACALACPLQQLKQGLPGAQRQMLKRVWPGFFGAGPPPYCPPDQPQDFKVRRACAGMPSGNGSSSGRPYQQMTC